MALVEKITLPNGEIEWRGNEVFLLLKDAGTEGLEATGFQVEGQAKTNVVINDQIDTGFMMNAIYTVGPNNSSYSGAKAAALAKADHEMGNEQKPPENQVFVVAGAGYSIYQETRQSFLYRALQQVARQQAAQLIVKAAKQKGF